MKRWVLIWEGKYFLPYSKKEEDKKKNYLNLKEEEEK